MDTYNLIRYFLFSLLAISTLIACSNTETEEQTVEQEDKSTSENNFSFDKVDNL